MRKDEAKAIIVTCDLASKDIAKVAPFRHFTRYPKSHLRRWRLHEHLRPADVLRYRLGARKAFWPSTGERKVAMSSRPSALLLFSFSSASPLHYLLQLLV